MSRICPGCDYASGCICDDCLDLIERRIESGELRQLVGCGIVVFVLIGLACIALFWK